MGDGSRLTVLFLSLEVESVPDLNRCSNVDASFGDMKMLRFVRARESKNRINYRRPPGFSLAPSPNLVREPHPGELNL